MKEIVTHILSISNFIYCYIHNRLKLGAIIHHFIDSEKTDQYMRKNSLTNTGMSIAKLAGVCTQYALYYKQ